jgi:hypothetical protein
MVVKYPTEAQEGDALVAYLRIYNYKFTHIPNETGGSPEAKRRGIRMKRQGVSKGFPDYLIFLGSQLIAIELKRQKGSTIAPEQKMWIDTFNKAGIPARICKGFDECQKFIEEVELMV